MIRIFTDGAWRRKDKAAGAGAVIIWEDGRISSYHAYLGDVTNNCAELQAVRLGLASVINEVFSTRNIIIKVIKIPLIQPKILPKSIFKELNPIVFINLFSKLAKNEAINKITIKIKT